MYRLLHMLHIKLHISAYFHCIFIAYLTNTVYKFAYFLHISCIFLVIPAYKVCNMQAYYSIFFAYLCIFLPDPFQLAGLLSVPVPFQQALPLHVCVHPSAHADSPCFGYLWVPPASTLAGPHPSRPAALHAPQQQLPPPPPQQQQPAFHLLLLQDKVYVKYAFYAYI